MPIRRRTALPHRARQHHRRRASRSHPPSHDVEGRLPATAAGPLVDHPRLHDRHRVDARHDPQHSAAAASPAPPCRSQQSHRGICRDRPLRGVAHVATGVDHRRGRNRPQSPAFHRRQQCPFGHRSGGARLQRRDTPDDARAPAAWPPAARLPLTANATCRPPEDVDEPRSVIAAPRHSRAICREGFSPVGVLQDRPSTRARCTAKSRIGRSRTRRIRSEPATRRTRPDPPPAARPRCRPAVGAVRTSSSPTPPPAGAP